MSRLSLVAAALAAALVAGSANAALHIVYRVGAELHICQSLAELRGAGPIEYAWIWRDDTVPVRVRAADVVASRQFDLDRLLVHVETRDVRITLARSHSVDEPLRVTFGPVEMWSEVPEDWLPACGVPAGASFVTLQFRSGQPWRARAIGRKSGSYWLTRTEDSGALTTYPAADVVTRLLNEKGIAVRCGKLAVLDADQVLRSPALFAFFAASPKGDVVIPSIPRSSVPTVVASDAENLPSSFHQPANDIPTTITLRAGVRVHGLILDDRKAPVGGASVHCETWTTTQPPELYSEYVKTSSDGRFDFPRVPDNKVALTFQKDGYATTVATVAVRRPATDVGQFVLYGGRNVILHIVAPDGKNVPRPSARLVGLRGASGDLNGRILLQGVPREAALVEIRAPGFLPRQCEVTERANEVTCNLERSFQVMGKFVGVQADGKRRVEISTPSHREFREVDPGGRFRIDLTPNVDTRLTFSSATKLPTSFDLRGFPGEIKDLGDVVPDGGISLFGRVHADSEPVPNARIWCPRGTDALMALASGELAEAHSDENGAFKITGIPYGAITLRIEAPGFARAFLPVQMGPDQASIDVGDVTLSGGGNIVLRCPDGCPGSTAKVESVDAPSLVDALQSAVVDGSARFRHVPPGAARVTVADPDLAIRCEDDLTVKDGETSEVVCKPEAIRVRGDVSIAAHKARGGSLQWLRESKSFEGALIVTDRSIQGLATQQVFGGDPVPIAVEVTDTGHFETTSLSAGTYHVMWMSPGGEMSAASAVVIPKVAEYSAQLTYDGGSIRGRVVDKDGEPVSGARIRESSAGATALSDASGSFELNGLEFGNARVRASRGNQSSRAVDAHVSSEPGDLMTLTLSETVSVAHIQVMTTAGEPAKGATIFVDQPGTNIGTCTTRSDGMADYELPPDSPRQIRLAVMYRGAWVFGRWTDRDVYQQGGAVVALPAETFTLVVRPESESGFISIATVDGWSISDLLARMGVRTAASPSNPLRLQGMPAGMYSVMLNGNRATTQLGGDGGEVTFP